MIDSELVSDKVDGHPALQIAPAPAEPDSANRAVLRQQNVLLPGIARVRTGSVLPDRRSRAALYAAPFIYIADFLHIHAIILSSMAMCRLAFVQWAP